MRVGIIRGDLPSPLFVADVEPVSQYNPPTEPRGQTYYLSRPSVARVAAAMADSFHGAGATIQGADISGSFPLVVNGGNNVLRVRTDLASSYIEVSIPQDTYTTLALLLEALNYALQKARVPVLARAGVVAGALALESTQYGESSALGLDSTGNGSTFNADGGFGAGPIDRTMPSAADFIVATLPVGGPLDVSLAALDGVGSGSSAGALALIPATRGAHDIVADAIAPRFIETDVAVKSFQMGNLSKFMDPNFNPDRTRVPALPSGAAITVVEDDGVTLFAASGPVIVSATLNTPAPGDILIVGTGLGDAETDVTAVKVSGPIAKHLDQRLLVAYGGSVSSVSIVVPAALIQGAVAGSTFVQVQYTSVLSNKVTVA